MAENRKTPPDFGTKGAENDFFVMRVIVLFVRGKIGQNASR